MTAEIIDDEAGLLAMVPEWRALWRASGAGPFQSPEWLMPWWAAFGTGRPLVGVAREGGAVRGVFPAYVLGEGAEAKVLPMGAGTTDYLDVLGGGAEALLHALLRRASEEGVAAPGPDGRASGCGPAGGDGACRLGRRLA